jgi:hypothetical protein
VKKSPENCQGNKQPAAMNAVLAASKAARLVGMGGNLWQWNVGLILSEDRLTNRNLNQPMQN